MAELNSMQERLQPMLERLQRLLDRRDIEDALLRYYRGMDRFDEDLMLSAFHPDAIEHHGGTAEGNAWEVSRRLLRVAATFSKAHIHFLGNISIDFTGADTAQSEAYFHAVSRIEDDRGRRDYVVMGRMLDRFERRDGEWRIAERLLVRDVDRVDPVVEVAPDTPRTVRGRRDRGDPSYRQEPKQGRTGGQQP
jgi:hypothetical protein